MGTVLFDLDGTLVDSQKRLYRLFRSLCPECTMTYDEYWKIKRGRISQAEFLRRFYNYDDCRVLEFHEKWMKRVEDPDAVLTDIPVKGSSEMLASMVERHNLYVLTARQNAELAREQIERFGWGAVFTDVLVVNPGQSKASRAQESVNLSSRDILVGDTGEDVCCARTLEIGVAAVSWGILSPEVLMEYGPDYLATDMASLEQYLKDYTR